MRTIVRSLSTALCLLGLATTSHSAEFPSKKLTIINPFSSGGSSYLQASSIANELENIFDEKVVVLNKPGGGGGVGMLAGKRAKADGYNMVLTCLGPSGLTPNRSNVGYNTPEDFAAVARVSTMPYAIATNLNTGVHSFEDLLSAARLTPNSISYGTTGAGLMQHMMFSDFLKKQNIEMKHVPFNGGAKALSGLLGNHIDVSVQTASEYLPHYQAKTVKLLAVTGEKRFPAYPDVPTLKELGYTTNVQGTWFGLVVPKKTDKAKIAILEEGVKKALQSQAVIDNFNKSKINIDYLPGSGLDKIIASEYSELKTLVKDQ